jgi:hypothetical protein
MIAVFHRVSDLTATGTAGSEQVELAKGLLSDSSTQVIYQQPSSELEQTRQVLRLSEAEARSCSLVRPPRRCWCHRSP